MKMRLHEIQNLIHEPLLQPALDAVATVELRLNNKAALVAAADTIAKTAYEFADQADGEKLTAVDQFLPRPEQYKN